MQVANYDTKNGDMSFAEGLIYPIRKMTMSSEMGNLEIFENLEKIDRYLQDEDSITKLMFILPTYKMGLSIIAEGLFSTNQEIIKITVKLLTKIQRCKIGQIAVQ